MLDIEKLTAPLNENSPCGEDPEYSGLFMEMEKARQGEPERAIGKSVIDAVEPDWKLVEKLALQLFDSTKDLRVAASLSLALLHTDGFTGFRDGLLLTKTLLETFWGCLHPELDPDDGNPAIMRGNALLCLVDYRFLMSMKRQPLITTKIFGKFSLHDIQEAQNHKTSTVNEEIQQYQRVEAAFREAIEAGVLPDVLNVLDACRQYINRISQLFQDKVGHANAPNFMALQEIIDAAFKLVASRIPEPVNIKPQDNIVETLNKPEGNNMAMPPQMAAITQGGENSPMSIQNRDDVLRALDLICEYYTRYEPGSPVPLMLARARNLVNKDFIGILQELSPESAAQIAKLFGSGKT
ncbi:type VI secretion system protein TssA [Candidatus Thiothrix sp. Deng01]|uniref:Type VI secretion system protein TssA n=1 Tax=Candidatus Thiothrix phosphatis TaxID=3112415 RepID=A0ABU6CWP9_9GAMM|nr:type VI secretion system protein TssA [Candidatus Thiothrix sp. Deng01]MEB4591265.1 type VI secretion system protein TssA [Candidatus Thiothrix sp. Deng01]